MESLIVLAVVPFVVGLLAMEFYDFSDGWARKIVKRSGNQLPEEVRDRYIEEWNAHLDQVPGKIRRLMAAFGIAWGASRVGQVVALPIPASPGFGRWASFRLFSKIVAETKSERAVVASAMLGAISGLAPSVWWSGEQIVNRVMGLFF